MIDTVKQERFQLDSKKDFLPARWLKLELCTTLERDLIRRQDSFVTVSVPKFLLPLVCYR